MTAKYQVVAAGLDPHILDKEDALYIASELADESNQKVYLNEDTIFVGGRAYARMIETIRTEHVMGRWAAYKLNNITNERSHAAFADTRQGAVLLLEHQLKTISKYQ